VENALINVPFNRNLCQNVTVCIADDNLLVGTRHGHLLMYSVSCRYGEQKPDVQLLRYNKNFSKKPIQQLAVVPEYQLLISLSGMVSLPCDSRAPNFNW